MGAKLKSKTHLLNMFFDFLSRFLRICSQSSKKVLIWPKKIFLGQKSEKGSKNAEFHADFNHVEKVVKKCTKKKLYFLVHFFNTFSTDSKSAWNSAFFDIFFDFFQKIFFLGHISTFFELGLQLRRKWLKKTENLFLWMYLRIQLYNHQRVCITKLLKSLYPAVHSK